MILHQQCFLLHNIIISQYNDTTWNQHVIYQKIIARSLLEEDAEWHWQPLDKWHFQPPTASHMSGVWERLIRCVRNTMKAIFSNPQAFVAETLRTMFAETVRKLNSQPLCPSSDNLSDWECITPSHLFQQCQGITSPSGVFKVEDPFHFWTTWLCEYLSLLQEHKKWILKQRNLAMNNLVTVVTENASHGHWMLNWVPVLQGLDGLVCAADVKTKS